MMLRDSTHANTSLTFEQYYPGFILSILDSASGKLSMAFAPDEERANILRWMRVSQEIALDYLAHAEISLDVEKIRRQGYAVQGRNHFNRTPGKTSLIAVPIFLGERFEAAMTMVFFVSAMRLGAAVEQYLGDFKDIVRRISADLNEARSAAL